MNKKQWFVFGIGFILLGSFLRVFGTGICTGNDSLFVGCMIRRYAFNIQFIISYALGLLFLICGSLEPKKK